MEKENIKEDDGFIFNRESEWGTYDGRKVKIKDMEDSHVLNLLSYIGRRVSSIQDQMNTYLKDGVTGGNEYESMMYAVKQDCLDKNLKILNVINEEIDIRDLDRSKVEGEKSLPFKKDGIWMEWKKDAPRPTPVPSSIDFISPLEDRVKNLRRSYEHQN